MMRLGEKKLFHDCLPVNINRHETEALNKAIEFYITAAAINRSLSFKAPRKLALISGAGIAGLAASFELIARGFNVVIAEKRKDFSRFNIINLDVEVQRFLKKFGLLDEFEKTVGERINTHKYVLSDSKGMHNLGSSDVSKLQPGEVPFEPEFLKDLFNEDGLYSVRIKDLQTFLAQKALEMGVHIFGNVNTEVLTRTQAAGVSEVQFTGKDNIFLPDKLTPYLFFVAEGAHSTTAKQLGMKTNEVKNECTGENWIFGNVKYFGRETFVVSVIDISTERLEIANIIFNARLQEINIAVTSKRHIKKELIEERILDILRRVFSFQNIDELPQPLISVVKNPVHVNNEKRAVYSRDNVFCIGDAAGHSSPLAGMGGTLGLTLVPRTIEQLINDSEQQPLNTHQNFHGFTEASVSRWIEKSQSVKKHCMSFFKSKEFTSVSQEQTSNKESEMILKSGR